MLKKITEYFLENKKLIKNNILVSIGFSVFLFIISFVLYLNFSYMGARYEEAEKVIFGNFKLLLFWVNLKILAAYLVLAVIIGIFSLLLKIEKKHNVLLFNIFFWFISWIRAIKLLPQLFSSQLFERGGLLKLFQVVITDFIPFFAIYMLFIAVILAISIRKKRVVYASIIIALTFLQAVKFDTSPVKRVDSNQTAPNVLIFATDSLRPQSVSYNGYSRKTPNIDRLFSKGVNFLNAKASIARTLQSWTSIFTSVFPPEHGMRHMFPPAKNMKKTRTTIIDILNRRNYYTAVVSDFAGDIFPSIDYGFQEIVSPKLRIQDVLKQRSLEMHYFLLSFLINPVGRSGFPEIWGMTLNKDPWYVKDGAKKSITKAIKKKQPFFIVHFSSNNHFPYVTIDPYYKLYSQKNYYGKHKYGLSSEVLASYLEKKMNADEISQVRNHYDSATKLFDDNLGDMLAFLKECNVDKNTIIVILSDHGENLSEDGLGWAHGDHLRGPYSNSMIFGVYSPFEDLKGLRIEKTVRDIDIAPTILGMLNAPIPDSFHGHSLVPVIHGKDFPGYPAYMETGIWYSPSTPFIESRIRIPYPPFIELMEIEAPSGAISLQKKFEPLIINAKYKALQLNEKKYIYMPGVSTFQEEFYINEKLVDRSKITDADFLAFKEKIADMFKGKFYIDKKGFLREF